VSQVREPAFDRVVALVLRIGAFSCFFIMLAGLLIGFFVSGHIPPVVRVLVAGILFLREKDWRFGAISFGVLTILLLGAVFGIGEH
jgi:uncharacterized membrane protein